MEHIKDNVEIKSTLWFLKEINNIDKCNVTEAYVYFKAKKIRN